MATVRRLPITLPPMGELRLAQRVPPRDRDNLRLDPPIPTSKLAWDWYAWTVTAEAVYAARIAVDFRLEVPGAKADGDAGDYVCLTLDEVFVVPAATFTAGAVSLRSLLGQRRADRP